MSQGTIYQGFVLKWKVSHGSFVIHSDHQRGGKNQQSLNHDAQNGRCHEIGQRGDD